MTVYRDHIGIDVSKDHLDIFSIAENKAWRIANEPGAIRDFPRRRSRESLIVFEATSVYDRTLRGVPARARRVFARVNPRRAHAFARATGLLAKTDRVDARMLAQLGAALNPTPTREPPAERQRLAAPPQRRNQLVEMRKQEKTRRKQVEPGLARRDIDSLIRLLTRRVDTFDRAIKTLIRASAAPAPFSPASPRSLTTPANEWDTAKIKGGGPRIGRALTLAALAARRSPRFKPFHDKLRDKGREPKAAIIAVARKRLVTLNAMVRDNTEFEPTTA